MDFKEQRRHNLKKLYAESGAETYADFVEVNFTKITPNYFNQLINGSRGIGEKKAREIEAECGKPQYWLDWDHSKGKFVDGRSTHELAASYNTEMPNLKITTWAFDTMDYAYKVFIKNGDKATNEKRAELFADLHALAIRDPQIMHLKPETALRLVLRRSP